MKRDLFMRPTRMVHKFGETEKLSDPMGTSTFDFTPPVFPKQRGADDVSITMKGEERYLPARSPIQKMNGQMADFSGPSQNPGDCVSFAIPIGVRKRVTPGKGN